MEQLSATEWNQLASICNRHGREKVTEEFQELCRTHDERKALLELKKKYWGKK